MPGQAPLHACAIYIVFLAVSISSENLGDLLLGCSAAGQRKVACCDGCIEYVPETSFKWKIPAWRPCDCRLPWGPISLGSANPSGHRVLAPGQRIRFASSV